MCREHMSLKFIVKILITSGRTISASVRTVSASGRTVSAKIVRYFIMILKSSNHKTRSISVYMYIIHASTCIVGSWVL